MTFGNLQKRLLKRWWLVLVSSAIVTLLFIPWIGSKAYYASSVVGLSFNNQKFTLAQNNIAQGYVSSEAAFSEYLEGRFSAIDIQQQLATKANLKIKNLQDKKPYYVVSRIGNGFISIGYQADNQDDAKKFNESTIEAYNLIVKEWNDARLDEFKVEPKQNFNQSISPVTKSVQIQILPSLVGLLFGTAISLLIPLKTEFKKEK